MSEARQLTEARNMLVEAGVKEVPRGSVFDSAYTSALKQKYSNFEWKGMRGNFLKNLNESQATIIAMMYENQLSHMVNEDTISTSSGTFTKWALPMVRRLYTNQILPLIATVQPVSNKYGVMQTMGYVYDNAKGSKRPLEGIADHPYNMAYDGKLAAGDEAIRNVASNYSNEINDYFVSCTDTGTGATTQNSTLSNCVPLSRAHGPIRAPGTAGQRTFTVKAYYRTTQSGHEDRIATLASSGTALTDQDGNSVGTCDVTTGAWTINAILSGGGASAFQTNTVIWWQYWANSELAYTVSGGRIQSMSLQVTTHAIEAEAFPLSTRWTLEGELSWKSQQGLDFEPEVVGMLANEQALNIDRYGINLMIAGALFSATYTYTASYPGNLENIQSLALMISAVSSKIHTASRRAPANFAVMSPLAWGLLSQLSSHADWARGVGNTSPASHTVTNGDYGIQYAGTLPGTNMAVYLNPDQDETKVLIGYKGSNWLDAGFGYAPWLPLTITETLTTPSVLTREKAVVSWGSLKMLRPEYFGVITISSLPTVVTGTLP